MFETRDRESNNEFQFHELVDRLMYYSNLSCCWGSSTITPCLLSLYSDLKTLMLRNNVLLLVLLIYIFCGDFFSGLWVIVFNATFNNISAIFSGQIYWWRRKPPSCELYAGVLSNVNEESCLNFRY